MAKSRLGNHAASNSQFSREINASGDSETDAAYTVINLATKTNKKPVITAKNK